MSSRSPRCPLLPAVLIGLLASACNVTTAQSAATRLGLDGSTPVTVGQPAGAIHRFTTCAGLEARPPTALAGISWHGSQPAAPDPGCTLIVTTVPVGGRLEVRYQPTDAATVEIRHRLDDLPTPDPAHAVVQVTALGAGLRSAGVVFTHDGQLSFLLYLATATSLVSVVCVLPALVLARLRRPLPAWETAHALAVWALARQPSA